MAQRLGPAGVLLVHEGTNVFRLPIITSGTADRPAGTSSERSYLNPRLDPPAQRTAPGGPGSNSFTFDANASAAVLALKRINKANAVNKFVFITNDVDELKSGSGADTLAFKAALDTDGANMIAAGAIDLTDTDFDPGCFIVAGNVAYVIERVISRTKALVHRVGSVAAGVVTPDASYTAISADVAASNSWTLVVPAEVDEMQATVSQVGGRNIGQDATEDTVVLSLTDPADEKFYVLESLNQKASL